MQYPIHVFLDKPERVTRANRVALFAPGYARHSQELPPSGNNRYRNLVAFLQGSVAGTEERAFTDVVRAAQLFERFSEAIGPSQIDHDPEGNAHFTPSFGMSGIQHFFQSVSQSLKVDGFLEVRRGAKFLAV